MTSIPPPPPSGPSHSGGQDADPYAYDPNATYTQDQYTYQEQVKYDQGQYTYQESEETYLQAQPGYDAATYTQQQYGYAQTSTSQPGYEQQAQGQSQYSHGGYDQNAQASAQYAYAEPQAAYGYPPAPSSTSSQHNALQTTPSYTQTAQRAGSLSTDRSLVKYILLSMITFGIYGIWLVARSGEDLNLIASNWDGKRSMNYWLVILLLGPITLGIMYLIWWNGVSGRTGAEQVRRGLPQTVSAADFWLWGILGGLIVVGPFIFMYKWLNAMNALSANYNQFG